MECIFCGRINHASKDCYHKNRISSRLERTHHETRTFKRIYTPFKSRSKDLRTKLQDKPKGELEKERVIKFTSSTNSDKQRTPSPNRKETWPPRQIEKKTIPEEEIVILKERRANLKKSTSSLPLPIQDVENTPEYQELKAQNIKLKKELDSVRKQHCIATIEGGEYKEIMEFQMRRMYSTSSQNNPHQTNIVKK